MTWQDWLYVTGVGVGCIAIVYVGTWIIGRAITAFAWWDRYPMVLRRRLNRTRLAIAVWSRSREMVRRRVRGGQRFTWRQAWDKAGIIDGYDVLKKRRIPRVEELAREVGQMPQGQPRQ